MPGLSQQNIECELSYAYLHAVASRAGMSCHATPRQDDDHGIDAKLTYWRTSDDETELTEVNLNVQLKATIDVPADDGTRLSYFLDGVKKYDDLRALTFAIPRILVVLWLPRDMKEWLSHSDDELALRRCAHWVSVRNAGPTTNASGATIKVPKNQVFSPASLTFLMERLAKRDFPLYQP